MKRVLLAFLVLAIVSGSLAFKTKKFGDLCAFQLNQPQTACVLLAGTYIIDINATPITGATVAIPSSQDCADATVPPPGQCRNSIQVAQE
jgi:hypothetical protein